MLPLAISKHICELSEGLPEINIVKMKLPCEDSAVGDFFNFNVFSDKKHTDALGKVQFFHKYVTKTQAIPCTFPISSACSFARSIFNMTIIASF